MQRARRSQSIKIDIGNQSIQSISIADSYRLLSAIDNNRTHRKKNLSIAIDSQKSLTIESCLQEYRLLLIVRLYFPAGLLRDLFLPLFPDANN